MVPRRAAEPRVEPLALPLPPAAVPLCRPGRRERPARKFDPEYELLDTGVFESGHYWITEVDYVKADPTDLLMVVRVTNAGPDAADVHVLPTAWFRNTWAWDMGSERPRMRLQPDGGVAIAHPFLGDLTLHAAAASDGTVAWPLFCENETNTKRLYGSTSATPYPKDGINDHVVNNAPTVNPHHDGTKASLWYRLSVAAGRHRRDAPAPATGGGRDRRRRG